MKVLRDKKDFIEKEMLGVGISKSLRRDCELFRNNGFRGDLKVKIFVHK